MYFGIYGEVCSVATGKLLRLVHSLLFKRSFMSALVSHLEGISVPYEVYGLDL